MDKTLLTRELFFGGYLRSKTSLARHPIFTLPTLSGDSNNGDGTYTYPAW
jgi:hypothetical protein